jgi:hypothetical protein
VDNAKEKLTQLFTEGEAFQFGGVGSLTSYGALADLWSEWLS